MTDDLEREYRLTADEPVVAFEVTVCIQGGTAPDSEIEGTFRIGARTDESELAVVVENLADGQRETISAGSDIYEYTSVGFVSQTDWSGSGRRCSEPEVLEVSVAGLPAGEEVTLLNAEGRVLVSGSDPGFCGDALNPGEVSLNVERL